MSIRHIHEPGEVAAELAQLRETEPELVETFARRLAVEQVIVPAREERPIPEWALDDEDRATGNTMLPATPESRAWHVIEKDDDDRWYFLSPYQPSLTPEDAAQYYDRVLLHRIREHLAEREARVATLESAAAAMPAERLDQLLTFGLAMLADGFDWEGWADRCDADDTLPETVEEVWRLVTGPTIYDGQWGFPVPLARAGSTMLPPRDKDRLSRRRKRSEHQGVRALYRFLYYVKPPRVDFSDMYKGSLCGVVSADLRFAAMLDLHKYEPSLRFYCLASLQHDDQEGRALRLETGIPGLDTGYHCTDATGRKWFDFITRAVLTTTMVYGGNNFEV